MKFFILLGDGMADLPISELKKKTPLGYAHKPNMDKLATKSFCGMVKTIPDGMEPGSGPANMAVMGYDPGEFYTGRSPLEAVSLGLDVKSDDMVYRCNLVSLTLAHGAPYESAKMLDYSSGEITTEESRQLIQSIEERLGKEGMHFFPGRSYRHCLVWKNGPAELSLTPPHDISGKPIATHLPKGDRADDILEMMKISEEVLRDHPVNVARREKGLHTADSIWLWGQGTKPALPLFEEQYGLRGAMISAVDLLFGLGRCSGLEPVEVPGATGNLHTNFSGKATAAISMFESGYDYVYLHVEAPDECGHQGDTKGKVAAIESIDQLILAPVLGYLERNQQLNGEDYHVMVLPDHPTPISIRTHADTPVPFMLYKSEERVHEKAIPMYSEEAAATTGVFIESGPKLFKLFIDKE